MTCVAAKKKKKKKNSRLLLEYVLRVRAASTDRSERTDFDKEKRGKKVSLEQKTETKKSQFFQSC